MSLWGDKLHIGCGDKYLQNWCNVDIIGPPHTKADEIFSLTDYPLDENTYEIIYMSHVLEHVWRSDVPAVLRRLYLALRPRGTLLVSVPDLVKVAAWVQENPPRDPNGPIFGDYNKGSAECDRHKFVYYEAALKSLFIVAGFESPNLWAVAEYPQIAALHDWASWDTISLNMRGVK